MEHVGRFVPDYARLIKPIRLLLRKDGGNWGEEHTRALNAIAELVYRRLKLGLCDFRRGGDLHVDCDDTDCSAVLTQGAGKDHVVVAMIGRPLTPTERKAP